MEKETKYAPLIRVIQNQGWTIAPLIVTTTGARGAIHQTTKTQLSQSLLKVKNTNTKNTLNAIHQNAIKFFMHIISSKTNSHSHQNQYKIQKNKK
jgi:hypothetical protein